MAHTDPHGAPQATSQAGGHETTDASLGGIEKFLIALTSCSWRRPSRSCGSCTGSCVPRGGAATCSRSAGGRSAQGDRLPPLPRLQTHAVRDIAAFRAAEDDVLNAWGWVDEPAGVARIPVSRAIEILAERGLPTPWPRRRRPRRAAVPGAAPAPATGRGGSRRYPAIVKPDGWPFGLRPRPDSGCSPGVGRRRGVAKGESRRVTTWWQDREHGDACPGRGGAASWSHRSCRAQQGPGGSATRPARRPPSGRTCCRTSLRAEARTSRCRATWCSATRPASRQLGDYFGQAPDRAGAGLLRVPDALHAGAQRTGQRARHPQVRVPGREFDVVVRQLQHARGPGLAAAKKRAYVERYKRPGTEGGLHFLTGPEASILQLTKAVGFHFSWDPEIKQFAHAAGIMRADARGARLEVLLRHRVLAARPAARRWSRRRSRRSATRSTSCCSTATTTTRRRGSTAWSR